MRGVVVVSLAAVLAAGCGQSTPAAPSPPSTPPPAPVPGAPPKAVLSVGVEGSIPILAVYGHDILFDASRSTGDGLTYLVEFGDGASSTDPKALHASVRVAQPTARLTVTDRFGRTDSVTQNYYLAGIDNSGCCSTRWVHTFPSRIGGGPILNLTLLQQGSALTGWYRGLDSVRHAVAGTITGDRAITLRTTDGSLELTGGLAWKEPVGQYMSRYFVTLRLAIKGGELDGQTFDFSWHDPY